MPTTEAFRVVISRKKRPMPAMIFDMVDMRGEHRATFLGTTSAEWLLGKPMPFDCFPNWRLVPSLPFEPRFGNVRPIPINPKVSAVDWHGRHPRVRREAGRLPGRLFANAAPALSLFKSSQR
jgi:hypothetical protein